MFKNHPILFIGSVGLCVFGIGFAILAFWYLKMKATKLEITETELIATKGLLSKEHVELNLKSIRTSKVSQSFFNRIFGTGNIAIYTAGDRPEIEISGLPDPHKVRGILKNAQQTAVG